MTSSFDEKFIRAQGSPSKISGQRGHANTKHIREGSPGKVEREQGGGLKMPSSLGKENFPIASESRGRTENRLGNMSFFRALSPERRSNAELKGRSVSPSKRGKTAKNGEGEHDEANTTHRSASVIDGEFVSMLNEMEVPATLRQKLITLEPKVKESMMKGQATLNLGMLSAAASSKIRPPISDKFKKSKSSSTLPRQGGWGDVELMMPPERNAVFGRRDNRSASGASGSSSSSIEAKEVKKKSALSPSLSSSSPSVHESAPRSRSGSFSSLGYGLSSGSATAASFATLLKTTDSSRLEVAQVKRMRAVLSSESPTWIGEFVEEGGYSAMVARLKELLELEWREEQHDDQLLHELLRCFVALSTTDRGRMTLQSMTPTPFAELSALLYSEKRPGDLSTRKLLVELLTLLPDLSSTIVSTDWKAVEQKRESSTVSSALQTISGNFPLLLCLLHNFRDPTQEAKVDFIKASYAPRPFKTFISELLNINRDYFWVFCHSNRYWSLQDINVDQVECPKVPGGMTGGVEFEAMAYLTSLFRLVNTVCTQLLALARVHRNRSIIFDFHSLLFTSGMDRALAATRKASQVYYQPLHLELAKYLDNVDQSGFQLPVELEAWQSTPQLLKTDCHYFVSDSQERGAVKLSTSNRITSPNKAVATTVKTVIQPKSEFTSSELRPPPVPEGAGNGNTGKWLIGNKRSSRDRIDLHSNSDLNRNSPSKNQVPRGSTVNHAVQHWEQLTTKNQGALGLGWAPSR